MVKRKVQNRAGISFTRWR